MGLTFGSPSGLVFLISLVTGRLWDDQLRHLADWEIRGVVKDFGVVKLLNNPAPKSNNPKKGLLGLALDLGILGACPSAP